jgi:hypothetical protein
MIFIGFIIYFALNLKNNSIIGFYVIGITLAIWFMAYIIISIKNIFYNKYLLINNDTDKLKKNAELVKFGAIPFWIINFIILALITIAAVMGTRGILMFFVPIPIFLSYIIFLGTSIFSISYIRLLYKEKVIVFKQMVIYIILQLIFCLDIIGIIYLKNKYKNKEN